VTPVELDAVLRGLRGVAVAAGAEPTGGGLALFADARTAEVFRLPDPVVDRVVVDPTFATRDLARAIARHPAYRLLVLGGGRARLLVGAGRRLAEHERPPFPYSAEDGLPPADRRGHLLEAERGHRDQRRWDTFLRRVDEHLLGVPELVTLPLVVAAAEPLAGRFRRISTDPVVGVVPGNHVRSGTNRLATLARPVIEHHLDAAVAGQVTALHAAVNRRRAVFGASDVWRAAHDGRVRVLLVEDGFSYPARPAPDGRSLVRALDVEHPEVLDDAVDEIIEAVALAGGRTVFVAPGRLPDSRIAAIVTGGLRPSRPSPALLPESAAPRAPRR